MTNKISHSNQTHIISSILIISFLVSQSICISIADTHISTSRNLYRTSSCSLFSGEYTSADIESAKTYLTQYNYLSEAEI